MKEKHPELKNKLHQKDANSDKLLFTKVKWNEGGITQLGTVIGVNSVNGIKYLEVMTIFGKRCTVRLSKVKFQTEISQANQF